MTALFERARTIADAVLYEGYLLYPYRASAEKNQMRWQFGVLMPPMWAQGEFQENWFHQTELLVEPEEATALHLRCRFLHVQTKNVEKADASGGFVPADRLTVGDREVLSWDEAVDTEFDTVVGLSELLTGSDQEIPVQIAGDRIEEPLLGPGDDVVGRIVRTREPLDAVLSVHAEPLDGPFGAALLRVRLENVSRAEPLTREEALRYALVAAHTMLAVSDGSFVSLLDPPEWARPAVEACKNVNVWPVMVGEEGEIDDVVLASPIILYDNPKVAPESAGELYDGLEIDEILTLRTMTLTDEEKREARATDPRAAAIIDRVEDMPAEVLDRLHGAIRYLRGVGPSQVNGMPTEPKDEPPAYGMDGQPMPWEAPESPPWWDPGVDGSVSPETDCVVIAGVPVARGSRVVMRPRNGRSDAQDMFLDGRQATVQAVLCNVDDEWHVAVTPDDDPIADMMISHGRFLYFSPDELEPVRS